MKKINLSLSLSLSLFRKTFLIAILFSMINWVNAQDFPKEEFDSEVTIDSIIIKATPYKQFEKNGVIYNEDKRIEYYNDIVIYEIKPKAQKSSINLLETPKPAISCYLVEVSMVLVPKI